VRRLRARGRAEGEGHGLKLKDVQLDFEAMLSEAVFGHGFLHYGYWPDGAPETPSAEALGRAQAAYFDKLAATLPEGTRTILDVGSGTGANALALTGRGYALECLCPSEQLNAMARQKLPASVPVHTLRFEEFDSDKRFDVCLFAESFHYIELAPALAQAARYGQNGVVIFDYFRRPGRTGAPGVVGATRGTHAEFREEVERQGAFRVALDEDLTEAILPTFQVLDHIKNTHVGPFLARLRGELRSAHPVKSFLAERLLGRRLDRLVRPSTRAEDFAEKYEYRLIRLERA
jgi:SAM-dependent methyltransferase